MLAKRMVISKNAFMQPGRSVYISFAGAAGIGIHFSLSKNIKRGIRIVQRIAKIRIERCAIGETLQIIFASAYTFAKGSFEWCCG